MIQLDEFPSANESLEGALWRGENSASQAASVCSLYHRRIENHDCHPHLILHWEWAPSRKEKKKQRYTQIYRFFKNYDENLDDTRIQWAGTPDRIDYVFLVPGRVYFKEYTGIVVKSHCDLRIKRPTLITQVYVDSHDIVVSGDVVYSCRYMDIPEELENIINMTELESLPLESFQKLVEVYDWCKNNRKQAQLVALYLCGYNEMLCRPMSCEQLYKFVVDLCARYGTNQFISRYLERFKRRYY